MRKRTEFGWMELILGIILTILGIFTMIRPESMLNSIVICYGIVAAVSGIADIIFYVKDGAAYGSCTDSIPDLWHLKYPAWYDADPLSGSHTTVSNLALCTLDHYAQYIQTVPYQHSTVFCR